MMFALLRIDLKTEESRNVGHASSLQDAAKRLTRMAGQEAGMLADDAHVVHERGGYCVRRPGSAPLEPERVAIYTFEELPF